MIRECDMDNIIRRKRCKKCGGNLCIERDVFGSFVSCIQCSAVDVGLTKLFPVCLPNPLGYELDEVEPALK